MQRRHPILARISPRVAAVASVTLIALLVVGDLLLPSNYHTPILYAAALVMWAWTRNRMMLWVVAATCIFLTFLGMGLGPQPTVGSLFAPVDLFNRTLAAISIAFVAGLVHLWIDVRELQDLDRQNLEQQYEELAAREEEIARQNEELQSQTEELERQSEELRLTNEELARREKMLETLLALSRSLTADLTRSETLEKICATLGELVNGPNAAAAILERRGDRIHVICHHGFGSAGNNGEALISENWPLKQSFSSLVLDRNRTGFLEDITLRPDLQIPQRKEGPPLRAVLAAPLRIGGRAVGSVEVYHADRHAWTGEQITLVESLAAQTLVSLEAAELFERIEEERSRLRTVLQTVPIGIVIASPDGQDLRFNPAGALMLGVAPEMPLTPDAVEARWAKAYRRGGEPYTRENAPLSRALRGEEVVAEEHELVFPGGRKLTLLVGASPLRDSRGKVAGAALAMVDISEQKALQLELDRRRREAEESSVRKTRFLAAVSHDIRTPANAISLLAELLQRSSSSPGVAEDIPEIARDLKSSALSLVNLVSDVLDVTRFDSGRVDLVESEFKLNDMLTEECRQFIQLARDKGLLFSCELSNESVTIRADKVKLSRVFSNLVANAVKFAETGGIKVEVARRGDGGVDIRVVDTGPGIEPAYVERIFDEYFQLRNPQRDPNRGSGLGLAISRRLIQAMGGDITVESAVGKGSTFIVTLPASAVIAG